MQIKTIQFEKIVYEVILIDMKKLLLQGFWFGVDIFNHFQYWDTNAVEI